MLANKSNPTTGFCLTIQGAAAGTTYDGSCLLPAVFHTTSEPSLCAGASANAVLMDWTTGTTSSQPDSLCSVHISQINFENINARYAARSVDGFVLLSNQSRHSVNLIRISGANHGAVVFELCKFSGVASGAPSGGGEPS